MTFQELTALVPFGYTIELSTGQHDLHEGVWVVKLLDWNGLFVEGKTTAHTLDTGAAAVIAHLDQKLTALREGYVGATPR